MWRRLSVLLIVAAGCGPLGGSSSDAPMGMPAYGFGQPALELTIGGVHFGPNTPDPGSAVDLVNARDPSSGQTIQSQLTVTASSSAAGTRCQLAFSRFGSSTTPIVANSYRVDGDGEPTTPSGAVAPITGEGVGAAGVAATCSGTSCDGGALVLTYLAADHVEGYYSGTLSGTGGQGVTDVVCAFYLPTRTYTP